MGADKNHTNNYSNNEHKFCRIYEFNRGLTPRPVPYARGLVHIYRVLKIYTYNILTKKNCDCLKLVLFQGLPH